MCKVKDELYRSNFENAMKLFVNLFDAIVPFSKLIPYSRKFLKGLIFKNSSFFQNNFLKSIMLSCTCTSGMFHSGLRIMALIKHIESSKEERIKSVLP